MDETKLPLRQQTMIRNWRRFRLRGVVQTLRNLGFPAEADAVQFHLDEEARMWGRHRKQPKEGTN